jgi:hypothetical protein
MQTDFGYVEQTYEFLARPSVEKRKAKFEGR